MRINQQGLDLIKQFEGCPTRGGVCYAYNDGTGTPTIGYGHTKGVKYSDTCTLEQAEEYLKQDVASAEKNVASWDYLYHWNINEFSALVSFAFNNGSINQLVQYGKREKAQISDKILLYNKTIKGQVLEGLTRRRKAEKRLYDTPVENEQEHIYITVEDVCRGIWRGEFDTPWSKSDKLYKYFQSLINKGVGKC